MMTDNALELRGLCKSYESFSIKELSLAVPAGYITGLIGPNGAGKTTTIKAILNMLHYASGEVRLFGRESKSNAAQIYTQVGVVMDTPFYAGDWRAADVARALAPFYPGWNGARYAELLERFSIDGRKKVKELSRGMKVKLMLAAALSHDAKLLILDEPSSGLDPVARDELCELLSAFVGDETKSVLFSTHITADLEKIADYIIFMLDGRIVFSGTKESLLERYVLVKGGLHEIDAAQKRLILGLREYGSGFEGMTEAENVRNLPKGLLTETITLDEIIVFMNKGAQHHA